jgi:hypothetical protein
VSYSAKGAKSEGKAGKKYLMMVTKQGLIKKTPLEDFENIRRTGIIAISLKKGDHLKWARLTNGAEQVVLATRQGQSIRFDEKQVRPMGRTAAGVRAIKLKKQNDEVAGFDIIRGDDAMLLVVMENGFAKQTQLKEYKVQSRGGSGIKTAEGDLRPFGKRPDDPHGGLDGAHDGTLGAGGPHHEPQARRPRGRNGGYLIVIAQTLIVCQRTSLKSRSLLSEEPSFSCSSVPSCSF